VPAALLNNFWPAHSHPVRAFQEWSAQFFRELDRWHPETAARRASEFLRRQCSGTWSVATLAREHKVSPSQLRQSFKREFGLSVREYQRLARLVRALEDVRRHKVEAVALAVGYRSKKNFYRAFLSVTGLTPTAFRKLPDGAARKIQQDAQRRLLSEKN